MHTGTKLIIAGGGNDLGEIQRRANASKFSNRINITGPLPHEEIPSILSKADIFLFPTRREEGLPYSILESMAANAVVVTVGRGGIADLIEHNVDGILLEQPEGLG